MRRLQALKWIALALLASVLAWLIVPDSRQDEVALPMGMPKAETQTIPAAKRAGNTGAEHMGSTKGTQGTLDTERTATVSAQTCEVIPVQGTHEASNVEEARAGAAEDVRDVCPSNEVTQVLENCVENLVQNPEGVPERRYRCLQKGNCRICGDDLARRYEITR
jgi:hypothetical protein